MDTYYRPPQVITMDGVLIPQPNYQETPIKIRVLVDLPTFEFIGSANNETESQIGKPSITNYGQIHRILDVSSEYDFNISKGVQGLFGQCHYYGTMINLVVNEGPFTNYGFISHLFVQRGPINNYGTIRNLYMKTGPCKNYGLINTVHLFRNKTPIEVDELCQELENVGLNNKEQVKLCQSSKGIRCPICFKPVKKNEPVSTQCGHIYCKICITTSYNTQNPPKCPLCNTRLPNENPFHRIYI